MLANENDESREPVRPLAPEIVTRALCLRVLSERCEGEELLMDGVIGAESLSSGLDDVETWIEEAALTAAFSAKERELLGRPRGSWQRDEVIVTSWKSECVGVLAWALSLLESMPSIDSMFFHPDALAAQLPRGTTTDRLLRRASLRAQPAIDDLREGAMALYWRSTTERILRDPARSDMRTLAGTRVPSDETLRAYVRAAAESAHAKGHVTRLVDADFPAFETSISALDDARFWNVDHMLRERCRALNWLCGAARRWDEVGTDT